MLFRRCASRLGRFPRHARVVGVAIGSGMCFGESVRAKEVEGVEKSRIEVPVAKEEEEVPMEEESWWDYALRMARLAWRGATVAAVLVPAGLAVGALLLGYYVTGDRWMRTKAFLVVRSALNVLGCVWIKLGQWMSSQDLVPHEMQVLLRELRESANEHSASSTRREILRAYGVNSVDEVFETFESEPVASGSVGQVHIGVLKENGQKVAVKVRHPTVVTELHDDLKLLELVQSFVDNVPLGIAPPVDLHAFGTSLRQQADFREEAANLKRFRSEFMHTATPAVFPEPLFATESVLVESFEPGVSIQEYIDAGRECNKGLATNGYDLFLSMLLRNNFLHADCHAGNIFVRKATKDRRRWWRRYLRFSKDEEDDLEFVILDAGLVTEMPPHAKLRFRRLLAAIFTSDGLLAADQFLALSDHCADTAGFRRDMQLLFAASIGSSIQRRAANVGHLIREMLSIVGAHGMRLDVDFAQVVVSMSLLERLARSLDPDIDLIRRLGPYLAREITGLLTAAVRGEDVAPWIKLGTPDGFVVGPW